MDWSSSSSGSEKAGSGRIPEAIRIDNLRRHMIRHIANPRYINLPPTAHPLPSCSTDAILGTLAGDDPNPKSTTEPQHWSTNALTQTILPPLDPMHLTILQHIRQRLQRDSLRPRIQPTPPARLVLPVRPSHTSLQTALEWSFTTPSNSNSNSHLDRDLSMRLHRLFHPCPLVALPVMVTTSSMPRETGMSMTRQGDLASINATFLLSKRLTVKGASPRFHKLFKARSLSSRGLLQSQALRASLAACLQA